MDSHTRFHGIYPMLYALFDADGKLDREAMRGQVETVVAAGAHGIAALGLATEVNKLSLAERRKLLDWVAEDVAGRRPLAVTVAESNIQGQIEFVRAAADAGAAWVILQPPPVRGAPERAYLDFFAAVADRSPLPVALQVAPEYLGIGYSAEGLKDLNRAHPNVSILKLEANAVTIERYSAVTEGVFDIFNGRAGLEMTDTLRAGGVGIIPGIDVCDVLVRIFEAMGAGDEEGEAEAERLYAQVLPPYLVFVMHSIDHLLVYGKAMYAKRLGGVIGTAPRPPFAPATEFGMALVERLAGQFGKL
jgi:4-hydroxy-tetrahydrodipicolinate synthase